LKVVKFFDMLLMMTPGRYHHVAHLPVIARKNNTRFGEAIWL